MRRLGGILTLVIVLGIGVTVVSLPVSAQGGGSRVLQPSDPCLLTPSAAECLEEPIPQQPVTPATALQPEPSAEPGIEVEPLPAPEPVDDSQTTAPEPVSEPSEPELSEAEAEQVEASTITPLYDESEAGRAELEEITETTVYTENRVGLGIARLLTLIYLAFTGLGLVVSLVVATITYFARRKNNALSEVGFVKTPLVFACLVVIGGIVYAYLSTR